MSEGAACPACGRPVYDDRRSACGYCGAALPESLRRSPEADAAQAAVKAELEAARLADKAKAEAEARERAAQPQPIPNVGTDWINHP